MSILLESNLHIHVFGESHSAAIGAVLEGLPAGLRVDFLELEAKMARRKATLSAYSTKRLEPDLVEVMSGIREGVTTGAAICLLIRNADVRSGDYAGTRRVPRPSHADWPAHVKYGGFEDYRGGGQFSGRLTAPMVAAGSLCEQWARTRGVSVRAHIALIAGVPDPIDWDNLSAEDEEKLKKPLAVLSEEAGREMLARIEKCAREKSSCGGVVDCRISGIPAGKGGTMARSVESRLASLLYAVPAVKGVSFGMGFDFADAFGRECNDEYEVREGKIRPVTNRNGGILGGIATGADILFSAAFKPVPSIPAVQNSVDLETLEPVKLEIKGRHDVCIVPRAVPVVESVAAILAADLLLEQV